MQEFQVYIDGGYFINFSVFSAIGKWKPPDGKYHPDLDPMEYSDFVDLLEERSHGILTTLFKRTLPSKLDSDLPATAYPAIFSLECRNALNWRTIAFPQYKATRALAPRICNTRTANGHIQKLITSEPRFNSEFNLMPIGCSNAEGDDVIATLYSKIPAKQKILIAMDRDFLQIPDVNMIDMFGNEKLLVESFKLHERGYALTTAQFKLLKILVGDGADNLQKVFPGDGLVRCLSKYVTNVERLKTALKADPMAAERFKRNRDLMDFAMIPAEVVAEITNTYEKAKTEYERNNAKSGGVETLCDYSIL